MRISHIVSIVIILIIAIIVYVFIPDYEMPAFIIALVANFVALIVYEVVISEIADTKLKKIFRRD